MFAVHAVPGPLQKVGEAQEPPLQTPEQQTPPLVALQAAAVSRQVLPGPPSVPPSSGVPPSSKTVLGPPQLHAAKVYPITSATENANSDFLIVFLRLSNDETASVSQVGSCESHSVEWRARPTRRSRRSRRGCETMHVECQVSSVRDGVQRCEGTSNCASRLRAASSPTLGNCSQTRQECPRLRAPG
jgi:hypothetical protein